MRNKVIGSIREFNRFYTAVLGIVNNHILDTGFSLTEARIIYEVAKMKEPTAAEIKEKLQLDEGYMSRIVARFVREKILLKTRSKADGRAYILGLTEKGKKLFKAIDQQSDVQVEQLIAHLSKAEQEKLAGLIDQVKDLLGRR